MAAPTNERVGQVGLIMRKPSEFIVKQNCCWKIVVRRMQGVRSINKPLHRGKGGLLFAYDSAMAFQIQFCLTIIWQTTRPNLNVWLSAMRFLRSSFMLTLLWPNVMAIYAH